MGAFVLEEIMKIECTAEELKQLIKKEPPSTEALFISNYSERQIIGYYQKSAAQHRFYGEHEIRILTDALHCFGNLQT